MSRHIAFLAAIHSFHERREMIRATITLECLNPLTVIVIDESSASTSSEFSAFTSYNNANTGAFEVWGIVQFRLHP